jgi:hypothetical protein
VKVFSEIKYYYIYVLTENGDFYIIFVVQEIAAAYRIIAHVNSIDGTIKVEAPGINGW